MPVLPRPFADLPPDVQRNFRYDAAAAVLWAVMNGLSLPYLAVTAVRLGAGPAAVALISASPFLGLLLSAYWGGRSQGKPQLPWVVLPGALARSLLFLFALPVSIPLYLAIVLGFFVISAASGPAYTALVHKMYPETHRGRLYGSVRVGLGLVQIPVLALSGWLLDRFGYREVFPLAGVFGVAASLVFAGVREPREDHGPDTEAPTFRLGHLVAALTRSRVFLAYQLCFFVFGFANLLLMPVYPLYQVDTLHLNDAGISLLAMAYTATWLLAYPLAGFLVDRRGPRAAIALGIVSYTVTPLLYAFVGSLGSALVAAATQALGDASLDIGWQTQVMAVAPEQVPTYAGLHLSLLGVRGTLAPFVGAALVSRLGSDRVFLLGAVLAFAALLPWRKATRLEDAARRHRAHAASRPEGPSASCPC